VVHFGVNYFSDVNNAGINSIVVHEQIVVWERLNAKL